MTKRPESIFGIGVLLLVLVWNAACAGKPKTSSSSQAERASIVDEGAASVASQSRVFATKNQLVARYSIQLNEGEEAEVEFGPTTSYGLRTWKQSAPDGGGIANFLVAGMLPSTLYHMRAAVQRADGTSYKDADQVFVTGAVPAAWMPAVSVERTGDELPSGGVELLSLNSESPKLEAVAYDLKGNLIWYYDFGAEEASDQPHAIKLLPNGDMMVLTAGVDSNIREIDLAGNSIWDLPYMELNQRLYTRGFPITLSGFNGDFIPLPNGHTVIIGTVQLPFTDLPGYPGTILVSGDALIDLDEDGQPAWVWSSFDHLDVNRHPSGLPDWTHADALVYSPDDGNIILSMRNQSWVIKIDYRDGQGTGKILWRLGAGGDFTLTNGGFEDWNYGQTFPSIISPNSTGIIELGLFDNGTKRPINAVGATCAPTTNPPCHSRPVVFQLNETAMTARIEWQNRLPTYSFCCGDMHLLSNGNMEFDIAAVEQQPQFSTVEEVTYTSDPQLVWQMIVQGQLAYRATRLPSLYPSVQW
jgi:arylsulfate sulfotransferase